MPNLQTEKQLITWGKNLIEGEQKRVLEGGKPIQNPSLANLGTSYENFVDSYHLRKNLNNRTNNAQHKLVEIRPKVDKVIKEIWDETEKYFEKYPPIVSREKSKTYGVNYVYRKNEEKIELDDLLNF